MKKLLSLFCVLAGVMFSPSLMAHTSEIFFAEANANNSQNRPSANVLFVIDTSGSMCDPPSGNRNCQNASTPMAALRNAFSIMIDSLGSNINIGLSKFNGGAQNFGYGGYVFYPVSEMNDGSKDEVKGIVNDLLGTSNTPTMEAYSEAARYMMGMAPTGYAKEGEAIQDVPRPAVNMRYVCTNTNIWGNCTANGWVSDDFYDSPINTMNQCETNHIIVMTDGAPTEDADYASVNNIVSDMSGTCRDRSSGFEGTNHERRSFACQAELAGWLEDESRNSKRSIRTWQVAFGVGANSNEVKNMRRVAQAGGTDDVWYADDAEDLADAFAGILDLIDTDSRSISAPGVAVNQMSRLQHLGQLYYSVFQPEVAGVWEGNLKRYRLEGDMVLDARGNNAVDSETGYFRDGSKSFWNNASESDGDDATKGGAREHLANRNAPRTLYYGDGNGNILELTDQRLNQLGAADLGIPSGSGITKEDVVSRLRTLWADPLHSVPVLVNYDSASADEDDQENYVFVSTNGGMLHAIDASSGREMYAFMPHEMLRQAYTFAYPRDLDYHNARPHYGLDGSWIAWRRGNIAGTNQASKVYLYGGMRRGGQHYYALDVTNPSQPTSSLLWEINPESDGFELLGQTWSTPTLIQLRIDNENVPALVFGGGYSPADHDKRCANANMCPVDDLGRLLASADPSCSSCNRQVPQIGNEDRMGNAVYIVNALTGDMIWSASARLSGASGAGHTNVPEMKWAVPGGISVVDKNLDGYADHLYFGDLGAQIFRVDLNFSAESNSDVAQRVVKLAKFTEGGTSGARRFFEAPAIAYVEEGGIRKLVVATVSGYRVHPLERAVEERVYVVHDDTVFFSGDANYQTPNVIRTGDLHNVTNLANVTENGLANSSGWYMELEKNGEKSMASPVIFNGRLLFTTYSPDTGDQNPDPCKVRYGQSYLYVVDLMTSRPAPLTNSGEVTDRRRDLDAQVPVSEPQIIIDGEGGAAIVVGTEVFGDVDAGNMDLRKRRWYPLPKTDANEFIYGPLAQEDDEP